MKTSRIWTAMAAWSAILLAAFSVASAGTIRVNRDGTGDFTVLQDGLDAAAAGDTIRIGPGRYDDFRIVQTRSGNLAAVLGLVKVDSLVIIGESADSVLIGPEQYTASYQGFSTFGLVEDDPLPLRWNLRDITSENTAFVLQISGSGEVTGCTFRARNPLSARISVRGLEGIEVHFRNCLFVRSDDPADAGNRDIFGCGINDGPSVLTVEDCEFRRVGLNVSSTDSVVIRNVTMEDGLVTLFYCGGEILGATIRHRRSGALGTNSSRIRVFNSAFQGGGGAPSASISSNSDLSFEWTRFLAPLDPPIDGATVRAAAAIGFDAQNCEFQASPGTYAIEAPASDLVGPTLNLRQNYWGTTDSIQIEELILDAADVGSPDYPTTFDLTRVEFWPPRLVPLPLEKESVGGLKSRFLNGPKH